MTDLCGGSGQGQMTGDAVTQWQWASGQTLAPVIGLAHCHYISQSFDILMWWQWALQMTD